MRGPNGDVADWWQDTNGLCDAFTCGVDPTTRPGQANLGAAHWTLPGGAHQWWIRTWDASGYGPWSDAMSFFVATVPPAAPTLVAPTGGDVAQTPTFQWNAVAGATEYYLYVSETGNPRTQTVTAGAAGCGSGGTCQLASPWSLSRGNHTWWVLARNDAGDGPWSAGMSFTVGTAGFDSQFNGSAAGWEAHRGTWSLYSGATQGYTTTGVANSFASTSYAATYGNFVYEAKLRRQANENVTGRACGETVPSTENVTGAAAPFVNLGVVGASSSSRLWACVTTP